MNETGKTHSRGRSAGSAAGFAVCIGIGFVFYFGLTALSGSNQTLDYNHLIDGILNSFPKQMAWFFMNFTEAQFYASVFAGIGLILGGFAAWILALKNSRFAGFDICYGSSTMFPWVLASQVLSLALALFVFRYIEGFADPQVTWLNTFITVVGAPPAVMLLYGPSVSALLTASVLGGLICAPTAVWIGNSIVTPLNLPGVVANVSAMAVTGIIVCMVCKVLPFVKKAEIKPHRSGSVNEDVYSTSWFIRRVLADFSEAPFYGNEVASIFLLAGVTISTIICGTHGAYGSGAVPAILLSQFVGAAVGVFLYVDKFVDGGWYATYVPVVSVGPACVLFFGATVPAALFAGVLGGIMGGPVAQYFSEKLPEGVHGTVANVTSMTVCTVITAVVMGALPWF